VSLSAGSRLGPYEVLSPLGAGGMGEVYRARDPRLGRDVALKVVAGDEAPSPERLRRFEREARAVAALKHPHILAVHDVGSHEGQPYVVFELLEGETLRERLSRGPLPVSKAIELAVQVCHALSTAHARGVVHRDLKPENLFLAREGGAKLLDFGLAKLHELPDDGSEMPTASATEAGRWVGTPGYISPEQLNGERADERSDVFAFGAVLYEMLSGQRAFRGSSRADTLSAILERDPPPMTVPGGPVPLPLERVVRRCLEKDPEDRFQSARDVAFALDALSGSTSGATTPAATRPTPARRLLRASAALVAGAALVAIGTAAGRRLFEKPPPTFNSLTFRRGWIEQARFAPDGRTVIYAAGWEGRPPELFQTRTDSPASRSLGLTHANVLSVSSQGQMAIVTNPSEGGYIGVGTLAVMAVSGAAPPRELLTDVTGADWMPDGRELCVSHRSGSTDTIELPPGNAIYRPRGHTQFLRVSPDGRHAAFFDYGPEGLVPALVVLDLAHRSARTLVELTGNHWGMAWASSSREVWFTEGAKPDAKDIFAVDLKGRRRLVYRSAGDLSLLDVAPDGRALLHRNMCRTSVTASIAQDRFDRDVSVANDSSLGAVSADGRTLLVGEGPDAYLRHVDGEPVRLAEGRPMDLSPDGRSVLVLRGRQLEVVPVGPDLPRILDLGPINPAGARFIPPDGQRIVVWGTERDGGSRRFWVAAVEGGKPRLLDAGLPPPLRERCFAVSPDGRFVAGVREPQGMVSLLPLDAGPARDLGQVPAGLCVRRWSGDGGFIFLTNPGADVSCQLTRFSLATGRPDILRDVAPPDRAGVNNCYDLIPSADGSAYASVHRRCLTDLILAEGLR